MKKKEPRREAAEPELTDTPGPETETEPKKSTALPPGETVTIPQEEWRNTLDQAAAAAEARENLLRLAADLDNLRKRTEREKNQLASFVESRILSRLLPALDNIDHALSSARGEKPADSEGLVMVLKDLRRSIHGLGLAPLEILGKPYDPLCAEAVEVVETEKSEEDGRVLAVLREGYAYGQAVLRPAMVRIARYTPGGPGMDGEEVKGSF